LGALGEDNLFKDFSGTNNVSEGIDDVIVVKVLLDFSDSGENGVLGKVDAVKTIVHDLVLGLNIHRDVVDEGTVKLSDFRVVDLSGQSKNS